MVFILPILFISVLLSVIGQDVDDGFEVPDS